MERNETETEKETYISETKVEAEAESCRTREQLHAATNSALRNSQPVCNTLHVDFEMLKNGSTKWRFDNRWAF